MIEKNGSNGAARTLLASIVNGNDGDGFSTQVLVYLKALYDANGQPIDPETIEDTTEDRHVFLRVLDMLREQEIITGSSDRVMLTTKGIKSLKAASSNNYRVAQFLQYGKSVLTQHHPTELFISILRTHFEEWTKE